MKWKLKGKSEHLAIIHILTMTFYCHATRKDKDAGYRGFLFKMYADKS